MDSLPFAFPLGCESTRVHSSVPVESYASPIRYVREASFESLSSTGRDTCETPQCSRLGQPRASRWHHAFVSPTCDAASAHPGHLRDTSGHSADPEGPHWSTDEAPLACRSCLPGDATRHPCTEESSEGSACDASAALSGRARDTVRKCAELQEVHRHQSVSYAWPSRVPCVSL